MPEPYEQITTIFRDQVGAPELTSDEATALLKLARRVAHSSDDRRSAPLVCYLAGSVLAAEDDPGRRLARIGEMIELFPDD